MDSKNMPPLTLVSANGNPSPPSWIDDFYSFTDRLPSPSLFRKWAGFAAIAGVLERRVWVRSMGMNLYPNLYTILVGPPGVGKTILSSLVYRMWGEVPDHHRAPSSVSRASLIDALFDAKRQIVRLGETPPVIEYNALGVISNELGNFIPAWDGEFMSVLTDIYDGHAYTERKRGKDLRLSIPHPCVNLLGCTTPSWLLGVMPAGAWDQGFTSRTLFIFSGEKVITDIFTEHGFTDETVFKALAKRLKDIAGLYGEMTFTPEAAQAITEWHRAGGPPVPDHPKLTHYITRRTAHMLKLCITASAATRLDRIITLENYQTALNILLETEAFMPDIFRAMVAGGDSAAMEETWYYLYQTYMKENKPVGEHRLVGFLRERVPAYNIARIIEIMVRSNMMVAEMQGSILGYKPLPKKRII